MTSKLAENIRSKLQPDVLDDTPIALKRERWETSTRAVPTPTGVVVESVVVGGVPCLLCSPVHQKSDKIIVYCHGGGLVEGSAETYRVWTSRIAAHVGRRVISIDYGLAPEHPYPSAVHDVLAVCCSLQTGIDYPSDFCVGADSSGCNLALVVLVQLGADRNPENGKCFETDNKLKGNNTFETYEKLIDEECSERDNQFKRVIEGIPRCAFFLSPSIDLTFSGNSFSENATADPLVSKDVLEHYAHLYAGDHDRNNPEVSPLFADMVNVPPILVMVDEHELLLSDSKSLVKNISNVGGCASLYVTQNLWHTWPAWDEFPEATDALNDIRDHIVSNP